MNSQLSFAVSQVQQHELREAAAQARLVSRPRSRMRFTLPRRFRATTGTRQAVPAISAQPRTV